MKKYKNGMSLVVLVITIIIVIIIASAVILVLTGNNPIENAKKASFLNDLSTFKSELSFYENKQSTDTSGDYDNNLLQADDNSVTYTGIVDKTKNVSDIITSLKNNSKYIEKIEIKDGQFVFKTDNSNEILWSGESGYKVIDTRKFDVNIGAPNPVVASQKTDVIYGVTISSELPITNINTINGFEIIDELGNSVATTIQVGDLSGADSDVVRTLNVRISTNSLNSGTFKLKINKGAIKNSSGISNENEIVSTTTFDIDANAPEIVSLTASPTTPTNGTVTVSAVYSDYSLEEYSFDTATWSTYLEPLVINSNKNVYFRAIDNVGNQSAQSSISIANIDTVAPLDFTPTSSEISMNTFKVTAITTDALSGIDSYDYYLNGNFIVNTTSTSNIFTGLTKNTTYNVYVIAKDKVGNTKKSTSINVTTLLFGGVFDLSVSNANFTTYRGTPVYQPDSVYLSNGAMISTSDSYTVTSPYTMVAKIKNITTGPATSYGGIFGLGDGGSNVGAHWLGVFIVNGNTICGCNGMGDGYNLVAPLSSLTANQWNTIAITHDNSSFKLYVNNVLFGNVGCTYSTKSGRIYVGGFSNAGTSSAGVAWGTENAYYCKFAYYNRSLTQTELSNLSL